MPPAALISSTASDDPFFQLLPTVAPAPESSMMLGILTTSCADADDTNGKVAAAAADVRNALRCMRASCVSHRAAFCHHRGDIVVLEANVLFGSFLSTKRWRKLMKLVSWRASTAIRP